MDFLSRHRRAAGLSVGLLALLAVLAYAGFSGLWRNGYLMVMTELRLARRGQGLVRMRIAAGDGMDQIYVPAGEFIMGVRGGSAHSNAPEHKVYLDAYWIDQVEVTNAMYARCLQAGKCGSVARYNTQFDDPKYADYPVVFVKWFDARDFCAWQGGHLPTEAQWEKAARGSPSGGYPYPWGKTAPNETLLNFNGNVGDLQPAYDYLIGMSPYGALNMAGNAREWVSDWYDPNYYRISPYRDPQGPATGQTKSLRGGGDWDDAQEVHSYYRLFHDPTSAGENRGFRCAADATP